MLSLKEYNQLMVMKAEENYSHALKLSSMGFISGEYGGRNMMRQPEEKLAIDKEQTAKQTSCVLQRYP
jgi:hypothetical protein